MTPAKPQFSETKTYLTGIRPKRPFYWPDCPVSAHGKTRNKKRKKK